MSLVWKVFHANAQEQEGAAPLYCMVSKFSPTKLGNKNVFLVESHVPSPTFRVLELYVLLPAGARLSGAGAMTASVPPYRRSGKSMLSESSRSARCDNCERGMRDGYKLGMKGFCSCIKADIGGAERSEECCAGSRSLGVSL